MNISTYNSTATIVHVIGALAAGGAERFVSDLVQDFRKSGLNVILFILSSRLDAVGNQMLDGLKPGKNQVWSVFVQQAVNSFIQLNVNYEGRNSGERTIHIGSMQVKASF